LAIVASIAISMPPGVSARRGHQGSDLGRDCTTPGLAGRRQHRRRTRTSTQARRDGPLNRGLRAQLNRGGARAVDNSRPGNRDPAFASRGSGPSRGLESRAIAGPAGDPPGPSTAVPGVTTVRDRAQQMCGPLDVTWAPRDSCVASGSARTGPVSQVPFPCSGVRHSHDSARPSLGERCILPEPSACSPSPRRLC
jgi:hypothetical protein